MPWYRAPERVLNLVVLDTDEKYSASFTDDGQHLNAPGYVVLCHALRDLGDQVPDARRTVQMSPALLQVLWEIQQVVAVNFGARPLIIHSGYRSMVTNNHTKDAVYKSVHCAGGAADLHVPGIPVQTLHEIAKDVPLIGGLGLYLPGGENGPTGFIHADVGGRRDWKRLQNGLYV